MASLKRGARLGWAFDAGPVMRQHLAVLIIKARPRNRAYDSAMYASSLPNKAASAGSLRSDAGLIGLVGMAHLTSHFSQLLLAPLFPWLKDEFKLVMPSSGF